MNIRHTFEERLLCAQRYLDGESACQIGKDYSINHHDVIAYGLLYKAYGEPGLHKQPYVIAIYSRVLLSHQLTKLDEFQSSDHD